MTLVGGSVGWRFGLVGQLVSRLVGSRGGRCRRCEQTFGFEWRLGLGLGLGLGF